MLLALVAIVVGLAGISGAGACLSDLARKRPTGVWRATSSPGCCARSKLPGAGLLDDAMALACSRPGRGVFICKILVVSNAAQLSPWHFLTGYWVWSYEPHADTACGICEAATRSGGCSFLMAAAWPGWPCGVIPEPTATISTM